jgi:hypothetical protein
LRLLLLPLVLPENIMMKEKEKTGYEDHKACANDGIISPIIGFNSILSSHGDR